MAISRSHSHREVKIKNQQCGGKQTLAPLLSREQATEATELLGQAGFGPAQSDHQPRILVIEVVPHAEEPGAFCLRTPPLALWDALRESKTLNSSRTTCRDLHQGHECPLGHLVTPTGLEEERNLPTASSEETFGLH